LKPATVARRCEFTASVVLRGVFLNTRRPRSKTSASGSFDVSHSAFALLTSPLSSAAITRVLNASDLGRTFQSE
jgi:hypothetical protein